MTSLTKINILLSALMIQFLDALNYLKNHESDIVPVKKADDETIEGWIKKTDIRDRIFEGFKRERGGKQ